MGGIWYSCRSIRRCGGGRSATFPWCCCQGSVLIVVARGEVVFMKISEPSPIPHVIHTTPGRSLCHAHRTYLCGQPIRQSSRNGREPKQPEFYPSLSRPSLREPSYSETLVANLRRMGDVAPESHSTIGSPALQFGRLPRRRIASGYAPSTGERLPQEVS